MSKPIFRIKYLGAQDKSSNYKEFLTDRILKDICQRLFGICDYEVDWIRERNVGRTITCEHNDAKIYINLSREGTLSARNSYLQSVTTGFSEYFKNKKNDHKFSKTDFYFYFVPYSGNNRTDYFKFIYRLMATIGIKFLNADYGLGKYFPTPFAFVKDIIHTRDELKKSNKHNHSVYITDEEDSYYIYGKTYGANEKETVLIYLAVAAISTKPIVLFQIDDKGSKLSGADVSLIQEYSNSIANVSFTINGDEIPLTKKELEKSDIKNYRSSRFIYNLLEKFGEKKCAFCDCAVDSMIEAAHILPVRDIKKLNASSSLKLALATDSDNGVFLCKNHHKLFDQGIIWLDDKGKLHTAEGIVQEVRDFVDSITTKQEIEEQYLNANMRYFINQRLQYSPPQTM